MNEKELKEVPGMEKDQIVIIRKFTYGDKCLLGDGIFDISVDGGKQKVNIKTSNLRFYTVVLGIKSAPFFPGENIQWETIGLNQLHIDRRIEQLKRLQVETGDYLFKEVNKFNPSLTDELKKKLV